MKNVAKGFSYVKTNSIYVRHYKNGVWEEGRLQAENRLFISSMSTSLHYGQQAFEGLKAYRRKDGKIQLFRVYDNARRFIESCKRILMPEIKVEEFVDAVIQTVKDNHEYVPEYGGSSTLYIRPFMIGVGDNLGLVPAREYLFIVAVTPVTAYFKGAAVPIDVVTTKYDRAAPFGTGAAKVGGNYAGSLYPKMLAKEKGFDECIYLDPKTHTKIEEAGAANFFGITKDNKFISPVSPSILKGITNDSLKWLAENILKMEVLEEDIYIDSLNHLAEAAVCGTAALITPIKSITHNEIKHIFSAKDEAGPVTKKLYDLLFGIQTGDVKDPNNWVIVVT